MSVLSGVKPGWLLDVLGLLLIVCGLGLGFSVVSLTVGLAVGLGSGGVACLLLSKAGDKVR